MLHVALQEQTYWKKQRKILRKNSKKLLISLEPYLYEKLEGLALYNENLDQIASELVMEGIEYIYMEDIPVREYHAFQHFIEIELSQFQHKLLRQLALKRGCSARKMAYTVLYFMLQAQ
ncbi:hypothetical protein LW858_33030 (plasmid) [Bacillus cereus]|uniref:hypothetical protein n=1 Tax=Bacillus cereus TaxID=1396 RepID=UPI000B42F0BC|nr:MULTISPECIES: hypothetical protein [Bacillus cereus group]MED1304774.1 hypothetical protein [Bacillus pacificus]OUB12263.1 hypothetical protein BK704_10740 [[Bacillus thuringiensis] serovar konkukian]UIJ70099.1 hypothetical protein LW858_33030 [Bacillus cereus]